MGVAATPLNVRVLLPCVAPKPFPLTLTVLPIPPVVGVTRKMPGPEATVNGTPLLAVPLIVTTTFPLVAVEGTVVRSCVAVQLETLAVTPLNVSVLKLCELPKLVPVIVTG